MAQTSPYLTAPVKSHVSLSMRSIIAVFSISAVLSSAATAQEANPAFWLLMPLAGQILKCAEQGDEMRRNLDESLRTARETAPKLMPASAWQILRMGLTSQSNSGDASSTNAAQCDDAISMYKHPRFSYHFRQMLAAQFTSSLSLKCIIQQPSTAAAIEIAWKNAFLRNGFELSEFALASAKGEAASYLKSSKDAPPQKSECERVAAELFGAEFDATYSEAGIYDLFSGVRR